MTDTAASAPAGLEAKFTTCYMCSCRCGIKVTLENGKIRYIQGNPDHPTNKGVICAKGSAGLMKQISPARLTKPLLRKEGTERGAGEWEEITWERAYDILVKRLSKIRSTDPRKLAFFTGRDQMQALTSYFAKQFGTPNFAAHGGFCSVNVATGMIYSIGGTGWEFGGPDWDRTKYLVLFGVAEDHDSNPFKIGIGKLKDRGGKLVVINPVRSGYGAVADEWIPIKPGTDGALIMGMIHVLIANGLYDREFLLTRTNAPQLVVVDQGGEEEGLFWQADGAPDSDLNTNYVWDTVTNTPRPYGAKGVKPALLGAFTAPDGTKVKTSFQLLSERALSDYPLEKVAHITGAPVEKIEKIALEMGVTARDETITLPIEWTDTWGNRHDKVTGAPVAIHGMRGLAAHSNGFQTVRALSALMMILGTIDRPGGFRHKPPFPRPIPPCPKPIDDPELIKPNTALPNPPLGFPTKPENLMVNADGSPVRIDKAFSWEHPLTAHGMIQNVITNAWRGDPYKIDTLMFFMANMAWNSSMNTARVIEMLTDKEADGSYRIPFIVASDAFFSEQAAYSDLVLPDTTYLERYDVISLLDRPISEYTGLVDSIRQPILTPPEGCEPFQETLIKLAGRLGLPGFCGGDGKPLFRDYKDFITNWTMAPDTPIGFLAGWRGKEGRDHIVGEPNPDQWDMYIKNGCFFEFELEESLQYNRNINQGYLNWALDHKFIRRNDPIIMKIYSEVMQRFRLAAQGQRPGRQPATKAQRERLVKYFDPLPFWYPPLEDGAVDRKKYPIHAITQRPMPMYHSWDSQNAWLRQIIGQNFLYINPIKARELELSDMDWVWAESAHGKIRCQIKFSHAVQPDTVWTWNAIGKMAGAWNLDPMADEARKSFLLNHLISEEINDAIVGRVSNSDPITGQAGWYDLRVRIYKAEEEGSWPQFPALKTPPGVAARPERLRYTTRSERS
ncbi:MAG: molybdopterin oxidoreductase family protein [Nitrospinae bacterium]|nr:molybdopterin oxidoreductase family protein [Nitrospinota bacterium]